MSTEIESQLEQLFSQLPTPDAEVGERSLAAALAVLPQRRFRPRRYVRPFAVLAAAALMLLALAAGSLAAAGALHVSFGQLTHHAERTQTVPTPSRQLKVPRGAHGIAAVIDGRLWLTTANGLHLSGLPVSSADLSPHALYVAAGIGESLVAMAPDGRRAWSHATAGPVTAIRWAPDGLRIAYVERTRQGSSLHVIEGNGRRDQVIDRAVRPVQPSWRADSLAVAYVSAGGKPVVYDLGHRSRYVVTLPWPANATGLAFAPTGKALAIATRQNFVVTGAGARSNGFSFKSSTIADLGWLHGQIALATSPDAGRAQRPVIQLFQIRKGEARPMGQLIPPGPITALDADGEHLTTAVAGSSGVRVLAASPLLPIKNAKLPSSEVVLKLPNSSRITYLAVR
jgi:hypothetical protein